MPRGPASTAKAGLPRIDCCFIVKCVLLFAMRCCFISCRETIGEQRNVSPNKNDIPDTKSSEIEKSIDKTNAPTPTKTPANKEVKKKKLKTKDTLKYLTAIP